MRIEPVAIGEIDVQPAVVVVVEEGQSASLGLDDDPLVIDAAPHVGDGQPCLLRHVDILDRRVVGLDTAASHQGRVSPFPKRSRKSVGQCAAEHEER